jgi:hypothetical protein
MAVITLFTALIACFRFDLQNGYFWLIPCFFGFLGGGYTYAFTKK